MHSILGFLREKQRKKRDLTVEEENAYIQETVDQCHQIMQDLSCNLVEAYKALMEQGGNMKFYSIYTVLRKQETDDKTIQLLKNKVGIKSC